MKISINFIFVVLCNFFCGVFKLNAQNVPSKLLKQDIAHYPNGNIHTLKNFVLGGCYLYISDLGTTMLVDTCYYGTFKEYYPNGNIKTLGQYDCKFWDKNYQRYKDTTYSVSDECFKNSIWYEFDSLGNFKKSILYNKGGEIYYKFPFKRDTFFVKKDSSILKMKNYDKVNSYLIKRSKKNNKLLLEFPELSDHNYWSVR